MDQWQLRIWLDSAAPARVKYEPVKPLPHTRACFACGLHNPSGLRLDLETDGSQVQTRFLFRPEHVGFRATAHGGLIATLLDEVMVWACGVQTHRLAYCAELSVRYLHPAPPGQPLLAVGRMLANKKGKLYEAQAELLDENAKCLARSTGKYIPVPPDLQQGLRKDFIEPIGDLLDPA